MNQTSDPSATQVAQQNNRDESGRYKMTLAAEPAGGTRDPSMRPAKFELTRRTQMWELVDADGADGSISFDRDELIGQPNFSTVTIVGDCDVYDVEAVATVNLVKLLEPAFHDRYATRNDIRGDVEDFLAEHRAEVEAHVREQNPDGQTDFSGGYSNVTVTFGAYCSEDARLFDVLRKIDSGQAAGMRTLTPDPTSTLAETVRVDIRSRATANGYDWRCPECGDSFAPKDDLCYECAKEAVTNGTRRGIDG